VVLDTGNGALQVCCVVGYTLCYDLNIHVCCLVHLSMPSLAPPPLRLEMKGLVCLASRTCANGMWYYVMITTNFKFIFLWFHC